MLLFSVVRLSQVRVGDILVGKMFSDPGIFMVREVEDTDDGKRSLVLDDEFGEATSNFTLPADTPVIIGIKAA
jgi:hypothetical protein